jgi:predicted amidophosphoribosyltransferase
MRIFAGALYISHIVKGHLPNNEVFAMKNRGDFAEQYAEVIQYVLEEEKFQPDSNAILVPIPQRQGSSNLAPRTLAMELARRLELDVHPEALESIRSTESQKKLKSHEDRKRNVLGSIRANVRFQRRDVLLVDDIVTFGCTMHEAAQVAESAGAGRVYGLAAAKDDSPRHLVNVGVLKIAQD